MSVPTAITPFTVLYQFAIVILPTLVIAAGMLRGAPGSGKGDA